MDILFWTACLQLILSLVIAIQWKWIRSSKKGIITWQTDIHGTIIKAERASCTVGAQKLGIGEIRGLKDIYK